MRPRWIALVVVLVAVPVVLAILIGKKHEGAETEVHLATQVSLELKGGVGNASITACGTTHHYTEYAAHGSIALGGVVINPPARAWKVKVKLKSCLAGRFEAAGEVPAHRHLGGRYKGSFPTPAPGLYFVRAQVSSRNLRLARSDKQFFRVR